MAAAYSTTLNRNYLFLVEAVKRYHEAIHEITESNNVVSNTHHLELIQLRIDHLNSMKRQLDHSINEIESVIGSIQKLSDISNEEHQKEMSAFFEPILNNPQYLEAHQSAKSQLLTISTLIMRLKESATEGKILLNPKNENSNTIPPHTSHPLDFLQALQQSFEGMTTALSKGPGLRASTHLTLPKFDGKIENFSSYWGRFKRMIDENNEYEVLEKVNLLCEGLSGDALEVIQGIEPSVQNYEQLKCILEEEFGTYVANKVQLVNNLRNVKRAANKAEDCIKTLRQIKTIIRQLEAAGSIITPEFCLLEVTNKFPFRIVKSIMTDESQNWEVDQILSTITRNVKTLQLREKSEGLFQTALTTSDKRTDGKKDEEKKSNKPGQRLLEERKQWPCLFCTSTDHRSHQCQTIDTVDAKREILRKENRCWICFSPLHKSKYCKRDKCPQCKGDHNTVVCQRERDDRSSKEKISSNLHVDPGKEGDGHSFLQDINEDRHVVILSHTEEDDKKKRSSSQVLLRTAETQVLCNRTKQFKPLKVVIDEGSMRSFIKADIARELGLPHENAQIRTYYGIGGLKSSHNSSEVRIIICTKDGQLAITKLITAPHITESIRSPKLDEQDREFIKKRRLTLANPDINGEQFRPDILIGMDRHRQFVKLNGEIELPSKLIMKDSVFGYLVHGCDESTPQTNTVVLYTSIDNVMEHESNEHDLIKNIFDIDSLGINTEDHKIDQTNNYFQSYIPKLTLKDQRIIAPLPLKPNITELQPNFYPSFHRLRSLWDKIKRDPEQLRWYTATFHDYIDNDIIEEVPIIEKPLGQIFYLPHHGVWKPGKPKPLRVVFDGSAKQRGSPSLNETIHTGLSYVNRIHDIMILTRVNPIIITCDIESAFLQIALSPEHRDLCRFLWIKNASHPITAKNITAYRFKRLPFGLTASPSILNMCLTWYLANSQLSIAQEILQCLYVDNIILFAKTTAEAAQKCRLVKELFKGVSMNVRQFLCNDAVISKELPEADKYPMQDINILGVPYKPAADAIGVTIPTVALQAETKRGLLRQLHSIYDPIGIVQPVTLNLKVIFRRVCDEKYQWDQALPKSIIEEWKHHMDDLQAKASIHLKRAFNYNVEDTELWVFADASATALACCAYFHYPDKVSHLLTGKTRLAPRNKTITIPRLELLAIQLACRMASAIQALIPRLQSINIASDSSIALAWLTNGKSLPAYVSHQVQEIHKSISSIEGRTTKLYLYHVDTKKNPADIGSRGGNMKQLLESYWLYGPYWLRNFSNSQLCPHLTHVPMTAMVTEVQLIQVQEQEPHVLEYNLRYRESRYANLRILVKLGKIARSWMNRVFPNRPLSSEIRYLSNEAVTSAQDVSVIERLLIKQAQHNLSIPELKHRHQGFDFFTDESGIIRIKSRLQHAPIPYATRNPIYIPHNSPYSEHIIMHFHRETQHQGKDFLAIRLRQEYYVPKPAQTIKRVIKGCVICRRYHALPFGVPQMPSLPKDRVTISKPFLNTGCDLLGPINLIGTIKVYVCLFTCMTTRAIHLEVVLDQSAKAFMNAFNRFLSRRGVPHMMRSDGAGNFTLSSKMLDIFDQCNDKELSTKGLISYFATKRVKWLFNTPLAPWKGGCWERLVGLTKLALKKAIGQRTLSIDDFTTLIIKIEAILNTRPLTHPDPNDMNRLPIRLIDFLSPMLAFALPDEQTHTRMYPETTAIPNIQTMEQAIEAIQLSTDITAQFWKIFLTEYLIYIKDIYKHSKGHNSSAANGPQEGEVVIIQEEGLPRASWKLGRIMSLIEEIRSVAPINPNIVKTNAGKYKTKTNHASQQAAESANEGATNINTPEPGVRTLDTLYDVVQDPEGSLTDTPTLNETTEPRVAYGTEISAIQEDTTQEPSMNQDRAMTSETAEQTTNDRHNDPMTSNRWWMSERLKKTALHLKRGRDCPKWLKEKGKPPSLNKQLFMICCLIAIAIDTTEATLDFCMNTSIFSRKILANPQCNETIAWATILIPIIIFTIILSCWCRLHRGEKTNQTWSKTTRRMRESIRNKLVRSPPSGPDQGIRALEEDATSNQVITPSPEHIRIPQYMRIGSRLSLLMVITVTLSNTNACQNAHVRHSTEIICTNGTQCYKEYSKDFTLSKGIRHICLEYMYKNQSVGTMEVLNSKTRYICVPTVHFYTRQTQPSIKTRNRCSSMGSCNDSCETIQESMKVEDIAPYDYPAQTGCRRSCGFIFCGCLTWSESCTFYKLDHVPKNEIVYRIISCDSWKTEVELEIRTNFLGAQNERTVSLQPYETLEEQLFNLTMISHTRPPLFGLRKEFAVSQNKTYMVEKDKIMINCQSENQAFNQFKECLVTKHCACQIDRDLEAACHCPSHSFEVNSSSLPFHLYEGTVETKNGDVIITPSFDEGKYTIESSMLLNGHMLTNDVPCHASFISINGCYSCRAGATLTIKCLSAKELWIPLQCDSDTYMTKCGPKGPITTINYSTHTAQISENCVTHCAGQAEQMKVEGILYHASDNDPQSYEKSNDAKAGRIDLTPLWNTVTNWKGQLYGLVALVGFALFTYLISAKIVLSLLNSIEWLITRVSAIVLQIYGAGKNLLNEPAGHQMYQQQEQ